MKYTFSIHGVPYGSQSWGDISDSEYIESFYNSVSASSVPTQMIVDIRYSGNAICSYYHYLLLSNVVDSKSRPGSYFGMTICFEGVYCSDFVELYKLFDVCFKKVVLNTVLISSGQQYKYALSDFKSANNIDILKKVNGEIRKNVPLFEHDLVDFSENFTPNHREDGWIEKWSIDDVGNKTFVNILLRDSFASISPFYPVSHKKVEILQSDNRTKDNKIKTLESEKGNLQSLNEELKTRISDQEEDIETKETTIKHQNIVITKHKETIATLESEKINLRNALTETRHQIEKLKEELKQAQNNHDDETLQECLSVLENIVKKRDQTNMLIGSISLNLKEAEEKIEHIDNQLNKKKSFKLTSRHLFLGCFVVVAIVAVIAGILLPTQTSNKGRFLYDTASTSDVQEMIDESLVPINEMLKNISEKVDNSTTNNFNGGSLQEDLEPDYDGSKVSFIDIKDGSDIVKKGLTYTLIAKKGDKNNRQKLTTGGGAFFVKLKNKEQKLESKDNGKTASMYVKPEWSTFTIIYKYNNSDKSSREVTAVDK